MPLTATWDGYWTVTSPELPVHGKGATPEGALDALASAVEEIVWLCRDLPGDHPLRIGTMVFIDLGTPCPNPDAERCTS